MNDGEKDPVRCRDLRKTERTIIDQLKDTQDEKRKEETTLQNERPKLSALYSKLENLQKDLAAAIALTAISRTAGAANGALTGISIQIQTVKADIENLTRIIDSAASRLDNLRIRQRGWENNLKENTQNMHSLNCSFD